MFFSHRSLNIFVVLCNWSVLFCGKFEENYIYATPRTFHSFIVTSNRIATIEDLKNNYKKRRNGDKATIYFDDFHTARVAGINLKLKKGKTSMYEVVSCTQYDQGAIRVTAKTFFQKNVKVFDIKHLNFVNLKRDMYSTGFHMTMPQKFCMNIR